MCVDTDKAVIQRRSVSVANDSVTSRHAHEQSLANYIKSCSVIYVGKLQRSVRY